MPNAAVNIEESLRIPAEAHSFASFSSWSASDEFPAEGRIDFLAGCVEVDMSPEDLHTHGAVKTAIAAFLHDWISNDDLGEVFIDRARVVAPAARLSAEPDVVVVTWAALEAGRVRYLPSTRGPGRFAAIEGAPDLVVEILSDGSEAKDTERLPQHYALAGVPEFWLVDARGDRVVLDLRVLRQGRYEAAERTSLGSISPLLGAAVEISRDLTRRGTWRYRLLLR